MKAEELHLLSRANNRYQPGASGFQVGDKAVSGKFVFGQNATGDPLVGPRSKGQIGFQFYQQSPVFTAAFGVLHSKRWSRGAAEVNRYTR